MPDTDIEPLSAAGGPLPTGLQRATGAQVLVIVAGIIVVACEFLPYRIVGYTTVNPGTGASWWPGSITLWSERLALAPAGAAVLAALAGLALRERARWLRCLQIGLWLLALASSVYITRTCAPFTGLDVLYRPITVCGVAGVVAVALLTRSLRRPPGRQPRWHLTFVLLAAAMPCIAAASGPGYAYGPGSGTATGIVTRCPAAEAKAKGWGTDPSRVVTVSAQNRAGQTVASQRLPLGAPGARYQMRLPTGTYWINLSAQPGDGYEYYGDWEFVPAGAADEWDFNDSGGGCAW